MPRASRYILPGHLYHITHRCHNRSFLLKFSVDRNYYRACLREAAHRYKVSILGYCITRNHIHLIVCCLRPHSISRFMQFVEGRSAQQYNTRKKRKGAFWEDRYFCTMIQNGRYLWNCLRYIDLNMMRAGVVLHPSEWVWCGYSEFMGLRVRYRILDIPTLLVMLGFSDVENARKFYREDIALHSAAGDMKRRPVWTESLAVGDRAFVAAMKKRIPRMRTYSTKDETFAGADIWSIKEKKRPYT
ncbi:MAG: transposase [Candidatus Aureabacteria bacterium]|nr:transposase [Candidatus Auribacterota bacterium]